MSKEARFEIFNEDGKWVIKDNEQLPHLLDLYKSCVRLNEFVNKIADLEAKLAKSEEERDGNYENYSICWKDNEYLNQQLAKKEQEIVSLKESSDKNIDYLIEFASLIENEKDCNRMLKALSRVKEGKKYIIDKETQDKIELLEKVRNIIETKIPNGLYLSRKCLDKEFDSIIKEIKGE